MFCKPKERGKKERIGPRKLSEHNTQLDQCIHFYLFKWLHVGAVGLDRSSTRKKNIRHGGSEDPGRDNRSGLLIIIFGLMFFIYLVIRFWSNGLHTLFRCIHYSNPLYVYFDQLLRAASLCIPIMIIY